MIEFSCENCRAAFRAPDDKAGKKARCPKCGAAIRIPSPAAEQHSPTDSPAASPNHQSPQATKQSNPVACRHLPARRPKPKRQIVPWVLLCLAAIVLAGVVIGLSMRPGPPEPPTQIEPIYGLPGEVLEHYVLYTTAAPELKADIAMRLERNYAEYSRDMADVFTPSDEKAKVFFIGDPQKYAAAGGEALGTFRGDNDQIGPRLMLLDDGGHIHIEITQLLQHEGWHQFCWNHVRQYSPIWLDEGLATYYGYGIWTGDMMIYGGILPDYFDILTEGVNDPQAPRLVPLSQLLNLSDADWRQWQSIHGFWAPYMQSWSVIQFLKHADGGAHKHLLDDYIADVAAGRDTAASAQAIADMQDRWLQWLTSLESTSTHGRYFEAIAAILTGHLARTQLNGQTFKSTDDFLAAAGSGNLQLGPVGSDTWLPPSVMEECLRTLEYFRRFYPEKGLGALELQLEYTNSAPAARVLVRDCNIDILATAEIAGGKVAGVKISHLTPLPQRFQ